MPHADDDKNGTLEPHELKAALEKKNGGAMEKIEVYKLLAMAKDIVDKTDEELLVMSDDELKARTHTARTRATALSVGSSGQRSDHVTDTSCAAADRGYCVLGCLPDQF